mgnify:CR=1 FL=1
MRVENIFEPSDKDTFLLTTIVIIIIIITIITISITLITIIIVITVIVGLIDQPPSHEHQQSK